MVDNYPDDDERSAIRRSRIKRLAPYIADPQQVIGARDDEHYFDPSRSVDDAPDNC